MGGALARGFAIAELHHHSGHDHIADPTAFQVDPDPAAARAHVTGRVLHLIGDAMALLYRWIAKLGFSSIFHESRLFPSRLHGARPATKRNQCFPKIIAMQDGRMAVQAALYR